MIYMNGFLVHSWLPEHALPRLLACAKQIFNNVLFDLSVPRRRSCHLHAIAAAISRGGLGVGSCFHPEIIGKANVFHGLTIFDRDLGQALAAYHHLRVA